jgi:WD40 repeat protein
MSTELLIQRSAWPGRLIRIVAGLLVWMPAQVRGAAPAQNRADVRGRSTLRVDTQGAAAMVRLATRGLEALSSAALDETGHLLAIGDRSGRVGVLDLERGHMLEVVRAHEGEVRALVFSGDVLCSAGEGGRVYAWQGGRLQKRLAVRPRGEPVRDLAARRGVLAVAAEQAAIELYELRGSDDAPRPERTGTLEGHKGWVRALAFSPDGGLLASGGHDGKLRLWNVARRRQVRTLSGHRLWVSALAFAPDGRRLVSAGFDKRIYLWSLQRKEPLRRFGGHVRVVAKLAFDPRGRWVASAGLDRLALLWSVEDGSLVSRLAGHGYQVSSVIFSRDGERLVSIAGDGYVRIWNLPHAQPDGAKTLSPPKQGVLTLRQNTTGERIRVRLLDSRGRVLDRGRRALARIMRSRPDGRQVLPDRRLARLLYEVADHFGREHEVVVISGYRSPQYNRVRRGQSRQVAKKSQHMKGGAIDFRIAGITITALHRFVRQLRAGGVGFYADSQFVHMDTGPLRSWEGN